MGRAYKMTAKGHLLLASAMIYPVYEVLLNTHVYSNETLAIAYLIVLFGALLPDIDEPNSYIGRRSYYLSYMLNMIGIQHRTLTHWLLTPALIASMTYLFIESHNLSLYLYAMSFGILMHDAGDMLTKGGIYGFLFPIAPNTKIALLPGFLRFETNSIFEWLLNTILIVINVMLYIELLKKMV